MRRISAINPLSLKRRHTIMETNSVEIDELLTKIQKPGKNTDLDGEDSVTEKGLPVKFGSPEGFSHAIVRRAW